MFKKEPAPERDRFSEWPPDPTEKDYAEIEGLAAQAAKELAPLQAEKCSTYQREHEEDAANFSFECKRYGDFLSLFISRKFYDWRTKTKELHKFSSTINLALVRGLHLFEGHVPDRKGTIKFSSRRSRSGDGPWEWGIVESRRGYRESPRFLLPSGGRNGGSDHWYTSGGNYRIRAIVEDAAREAEDDRIMLDGLSSDIYAPCGRGKEVLDAMLLEIARYWERERGDPAALSKQGE